MDLKNNWKWNLIYTSKSFNCKFLTKQCSLFSSKERVSVCYMLLSHAFVIKEMEGVTIPLGFPYVTALPPHSPCHLKHISVQYASLTKLILQPFREQHLSPGNRCWKLKSEQQGQLHNTSAKHSDFFSMTTKTSLDNIIYDICLKMRSWHSAETWH